MQLLKPRPLKRGDKIGIVAPAGAVSEERLTAGIEALEKAGFRAELGRGIFERKGYLAGEARERARALEEFFERDDIAAIFCARGGFGSIQLLSYLAVDTIRRHPKLFVGYSDVTILLNWLLQRCALVSFHGPMVAMDLARGITGRSEEFFWGTLAGQKRTWRLGSIESLRPGYAEAPMVGGCLSIVVTTLGTPYEIDTAGKILFLEDIGEKPYRVERMLTHLKLAGKFERVAGVVFGSFTDCEGDGERQVGDIIRELFGGAPYPVLAGLGAGHGEENLLLPFGVKMALDGNAGSLSLLESPVD